MTDIQFAIAIICLTILALGLMLTILLKEAMKQVEENKEDDK